jgi:hypothetical protein
MSDDPQVDDYWAKAPLEELLAGSSSLNPFQRDALAVEVRQDAELVTRLMLEEGEVPASPWPIIRSRTEQRRRGLVADFSEAQHRLRVALQRAREDPATWPAEMQELAKTPGAFRKRLELWPGPARGRVQDLVQGIAGLDYTLRLIATEQGGEP